MNRLIKIGVLGSVCFLANAAFADNAVKMMTYFPVPYVAYNNVFVGEKFDVGTKKGAFKLDLRHRNECSRSDSLSLKAEDVYLKGITEDSALSFDTDIYTKNATFGNEGASGNVTMQFNNLFIDTLNTVKDYAVKDVVAKDWTVNGDMYMIEDAFVTNGAKLPSCNYTVTWKSLKIGGKKGYYLVCGTASGPELLGNKYYLVPAGCAYHTETAGAGRGSPGCDSERSTSIRVEDCATTFPSLVSDLPSAPYPTSTYQPIPQDCKEQGGYYACSTCTANKRYYVTNNGKDRCERGVSEGSYCRGTKIYTCVNSDTVPGMVKLSCDPVSKKQYSFYESGSGSGRTPASNEIP